jgi:oxygen-independent coproporphyrinogen-3 oxidase
MDAAGTTASFGGDDIIAADRLPFEYMLNLLRLHEGFSLRDFQSRTGLAATAIDAPLQQALQRGWLERVDEGHDHGHGCDDHGCAGADGHDHGEVLLRPTELGRRFTNDVVELFLGE